MGLWTCPVAPCQCGAAPRALLLAALCLLHLPMVKPAALCLWPPGLLRTVRVALCRFPAARRLVGAVALCRCLWVLVRAVLVALYRWPLARLAPPLAAACLCLAVAAAAVAAT